MKVQQVNRGYYKVTRRYEYYFRVVKTIFSERAQRVSAVKYRVIFFLLYGQKSKQAS